MVWHSSSALLSLLMAFLAGHLSVAAARRSRCAPFVGTWPIQQATDADHPNLKRPFNEHLFRLNTVCIQICLTCFRLKHSSGAALQRFPLPSEWRSEDVPKMFRKIWILNFKSLRYLTKNKQVFFILISLFKKMASPNASSTANSVSWIRRPSFSISLNHF